MRGPLLGASGGDGKLRRLKSGPITAVQNVDLIAFFGKGYVAEAGSLLTKQELNFIGELGPARP
jgi:hypothetical protein